MEKQKDPHSGPTIWAVGGGKGGVGKSVASVLLSVGLARSNQRTILVDADLGGANLHTMLGIKMPARTLNDYITGKRSQLNDICIQTQERNIELICGASEILSFSNLHYTHKYRIMQNIRRLAADHVVMDLGAGNSFAMLDFFLMSDYPIIILTPQPISIQNAYGFLRNAVHRKLSRMARRHASLHSIIATAMDPKNDERLRTVGDLYEAVRITHGINMARRLRDGVSRLRPRLITNMIRSDREKKAGTIIQTVAEKYLKISPQVTGVVAYDPQIETCMTRMRPLTDLSDANPTLAGFAGVVRSLTGGEKVLKQAYR